MRIGHILPYDLRQPGGVQTHLLALVDALSELDVACDIFAPQHPLRLPLGGTRADLALDPRNLSALRSFLAQPHDILHIQEPLLPVLGPLALAHPTAARKVVTLHSAEPLAQRVYRWTRPLVRRLLSRTDAVICASEVSRDIATPILPAQIQIIPPCLDLSPFRDVERSPQPQTIVFVGRDEPRKGLPILLRAIQQLPHAQLIVAGPTRPETRQLANQLAPGRVQLLGYIPHDKLPALLSRASCAAFPALGGEALGLVLVEAMAAGLPVVASDIPGYRIATDNGNAALLSPPGDADALARQLNRLFSLPDLQHDLAARGHSAAQRFDAPVVARQHLDLYQALLED